MFLIEIIDIVVRCRRTERAPVARPAGGEAGLPSPLAEVRELRAFVAVARLGTVGRAAGHLGRTQPSISARLARLERSWGTRLFRRVARGMELTPEGARLLPRAESSLRELEALDHVAGVPVSGSRGLRLGAGDALGRELLPRALAGLLAAEPGVEIYLREGPGPRLLEALRDGEIDVALVVSRRGAAEEGLDLAPWIRSPIDVLAPRGQLGPGRRPVTLSRLAARRLVGLQPGSEFRRHLEAAFRAAGIAFRPAVEVGNLSLVRRFVAAGLGWALVPAVAFEPGSERPTLDRRRLGGVPPVEYHRAVRTGAPRAPIVDELLNRLKDKGDSPL